jgi:outer membrane protein OmpA-like peptidoglycan-associated protein
MKNRAYSEQISTLTSSSIHLSPRLIAEEERMFSRVLKFVSWLLAVAFIAFLPVTVAAQVAPSVKGVPTNVPPKWDIFVGYSFLAPHGSMQATLNGAPYLGSTTSTVPISYDNVSLGQIFSGSYYFTRYVGAQAEVGIHEWGIQNQNPPGQKGTHGNNDGFTTASGGLILRYPTTSFTPFAHVLAGGALVDGSAHNQYTWGPAVTVGGGLDYETGWWRHRIAIRLFQGDYEFMHVNFASGYSFPSQTVNINAARLSAGVVFHPALAVPSQVSLVCLATPATIFPGDPVTVTAMAGGLNPKLNAIYTWSGNGVTGSGTTATVATAALAPGTSTVKCGVKEGKPGKEGLKPWESADASASFTVKAFEPPTISCSATPSTVKPGDNSTITAVGVSPQNRTLTYSYSAVAGTVTGSGPTATYSSTGAPTGAVELTCNVTDDKGQTATANTSVTITAPYVAPVPHTQAMCSISFSKDKARPTRVDNEAKACLDEVALDLQKQSDAKAVVVGNSDAKEKAKTAKEEKAALKNKHVKITDTAAERAVNAKEYLVTEKGIDASRISVATGAADGQTVEDYLVPSGASFSADVAGTTPVDETTVKAQPRKPLHTAHKKAAKHAK